MPILLWLWRKWLPVAQSIGNFQAQVILSIFYIVLIAPLGILYRLFADPLNLKIKNKRSNFEKWEHPKGTLDTARKQY